MPRCSVLIPGMGEGVGRALQGPAGFLGRQCHHSLCIARGWRRQCPVLPACPQPQAVSTLLHQAPTTRLARLTATRPLRPTPQPLLCSTCTVTLSWEPQVPQRAAPTPAPGRGTSTAGPLDTMWVRAGRAPSPQSGHRGIRALCRAGPPAALGSGPASLTPPWTSSLSLDGG